MGDNLVQLLEVKPDFFCCFLCRICHCLNGKLINFPSILTHGMFPAFRARFNAVIIFCLPLTEGVVRGSGSGIEELCTGSVRA